MTVTTAVSRILIIDDHRVFTDLLARALGDDDSFECLATAHSVAAALDVAARTTFDIAIVDVHLPDGDGLALAEDLLVTYPALRVVLLTAHPRPEMITRAVQMGASALLAKEGSLPDLFAALRNGTPQDPVLVELVRPQTTLTLRELDVLRLLGDGNDTRSIAKVLGISPHTSRDHVKNILSKLGCSSQLDAVVAASRAGLIEIGRR